MYIYMYICVCVCVCMHIYIYICTGWNDKIVDLKKTAQQLYFKTFFENINSGNLIMLQS